MTTPNPVSVAAGFVRPRWNLRSLLALLLSLQLAGAAFAAEAAKKTFDVPAGEAIETLKQAAQQAGMEIMFPAETVRGVQTAAVKGEFTPLEAFNRMLAHTNLYAMRDEKTGALTVTRMESGKSEPVKPQSSTTGTSSTSDEITRLSPFTVMGEKDIGYRKLSTVTTSRAGVAIIDDPSAIEIISSELLKDFSITDKNAAFKFSSSVIASENETFTNKLIALRGFDAPLYYNGALVANSFSSLPYLIVDNIDRVEIAKGAQGMLYGNTTAGGVINYVSQRPQFINATTLDLSYGSFNYNKALLDLQGVIRPGLAYRLIASRYETDGRVNDMHKEILLVAPSAVFRPNDVFEVNAEMNYTKQRIPWPSQAWDFFINPQYFKDLTTPSQAILDYMKSKYGLSTNAAALAKVNERWGAPLRYTTFLDNWQADTLARTGVEPYQASGDKVDWWRYSTAGDKWNRNGKGANQDGTMLTTDVSVRVSPLTNLAVNYHWQHMETTQNAWRPLLTPNAGLRADGRVETLNLADYASAVQDDGLVGYSDTQQLDALYEFKLAEISNQFQAGVEWRRTVGIVSGTPIDFTKAAPTVDRNGNPLTGIDALRYWDPFGSQPAANFYSVVSGPKDPGGYKTVSVYRDYYVSYRAKAMEDKLNLLLGARRVALLGIGGGQDNTWTAGALYTITPGFRLFASTSKVIVFTNQMSIDNQGVTAADNAHRLANESGSGLEVGVKTNWKDDTLSGSLSYYKDKRANIVSQDNAKNAADPRNNDDNANNMVVYWTNGGLFQVQGIDGDITWTPHPNFQAMLNFNYMFQSELVSDPSIDLTKPNRLVYIRAFDFRRLRSPLWRSNLVMKYNFTSGLLNNLSVGGAIAYTDEYNLTDYFQLDLKAPAETIIDVFATYRSKIGSIPTSYTLNLSNLTNRINDFTRRDGFEMRFSVGFKY